MYSLTELVREINYSRLPRGESPFNLTAFLKTEGVRGLCKKIEAITGEVAIWSEGKGRNRKTKCNELLYHYLASKEGIPISLKKSDECLRIEKEIAKMPKDKKIQSLYIFENKRAGLVKVGIASNIERRKQQVQDACGCKIDVVWQYKHPRAESLEKFIHAEFSKNRMYGEWFNSECKDKILVFSMEVVK